MRYLEQSNPQRQEGEQWLPGAGGGGGDWDLLFWFRKMKGFWRLGCATGDVLKHVRRGRICHAKICPLGK